MPTPDIYLAGILPCAQSTREEAREWIADNCIPSEFRASFAAPLAGKYSSMPAVQETAKAIGICPDALVCHAVEVFLAFVRQRPESAALSPMLFPEEVADIEETKFLPSHAAMGLFGRLYSEAASAPLRDAVGQLAALRDLVACNPGFTDEHAAICRLIGSAHYLSVKEAVAADNDPTQSDRRAVAA